MDEHITRHKVLANCVEYDIKYCRRNLNSVLDCNVHTRNARNEWVLFAGNIHNSK